MSDEVEQLRRELRELRHRFHSLVDNAQDAIFIKDLEGRYTFINLSGARYLDRRVDEVVGRTDADIFGAKTAKEIRQIDLMVMNSRAPYTYRPTRRDFSTPRSFFTTKYPYLDAEGHLAGLMGVSHDVTEWVRAEEEARVADASFRAVVEAAQELIVVHDGGRVLYANAVARETLQLSEGQKLPPFEAPELTEITLNRIPLEAVETPAHWYGQPARVLIARDLRNRLELEARLAQSDRLATLGTLAAGVAHEVNNPLTYVLHHLERLAEQAPESPHVGPALDGARRIAKVVQDLRGLGRSEGEVAPTEVQRTLDRALSLLDNELRHRATVHRDLAPTAPVMADDNRLFQVFMNLLVNASHAMDQGGANHLTVRTFQEGDEVVVEIEDSGTGIDEELLERIFDPFVTTKPVGEGSGLGLWICNSIITGLGGTLELDSQLDIGTTVMVRLPATDEPLPLEDATSPLPPVEGPIRVLVVDDEPMIGEMLQAGLEALLDAEVVCCGGVKEALAVLGEDADFKAILCDLMMPGLGGPELFHVLQGRGLSERMIFMTGGAFTRRTRDFLDEVENEVINKPFRIKEVAALVQSMG